MLANNSNTRHQILKQMEDGQDQPNAPIDPHTLHRVESQMQKKIESGYTAPCGWLFRGLTFLFFTQTQHADAEDMYQAEKNGPKTEDTRLSLAHNTTRFAAAKIASSLKDSSVTHIIVNPETLSSAEILFLRESLAARPGKKVPHLVGLGWVEECWKNGTLLDEESKLMPPSILDFLSLLFFALLKRSVEQEHSSTDTAAATRVSSFSMMGTQRSMD